MKKLFIIAYIILSLTCGVRAQTQYDPVIDKVVNSYQPWSSVEFSGKVKSPKLPVTLTAKLYMERDSLIQLSLRAPLLGEVGRAIVTPQLTTLVYKIKRTYMQEPTQKILDIYPGFISDLQSLLLARVVVLGDGELSMRNSDKVAVDDDNNGGYMFIPDTSEAVIDWNYGYLVDGASRTRALVASLPPYIDLEMIYEYRNKGVQIDVEVREKSKTFTAELDFSSVKWGGTPMSDVKLTTYHRLSAKDFFKSF